MAMPVSLPAYQLHPEVLGAVMFLACLYLVAWLRSEAPFRPARAGAFLAGLVAIVVTATGPLDVLSDRFLFSAHMVQHLGLTLVVPPLLLGGLPGWMLDRLLAPVVGYRAGALVVWALTRPVLALAVYGVALTVWHLPGPYETALRSEGWHFVEHATLVGAATLAWWPVVSLSALIPRLPYAGQVLYLFAFGIPMTAVAVMITNAGQVLYPFYAAAPRLTALGPLEDQQIGGILMWVPAALVPLSAFTVVFFRWVAAEPDPAGEPAPGRPTSGPSDSAEGSRP
jgi:putative membrane protein